MRAMFFPLTFKIKPLFYFSVIYTYVNLSINFLIQICKIVSMHTGFHFLSGHSIDEMVFILYRMYFLSPYLPLTKLSAILDKNKSEWFLVCFPHKDPRKCPHKDNIYYITILNVGNVRYTHHI